MTVVEVAEQCYRAFSDIDVVSRVDRVVQLGPQVTPTQRLYIGHRDQQHYDML